MALLFILFLFLSIAVDRWRKHASFWRDMDNFVKTTRARKETT